jgi:hypothetical protein
MAASRLPWEVEESIVGRLFADMERLGWEGMTMPQRTSQYAVWIADREIGRRLAEFMTPERARVWIKDGPVKEYPRALAGAGKYAPLANGNANVTDIVRRALGTDWTSDIATLRVKTLRVEAHRDEDTVVLTWGPSKDLKHLVWAALNADASGDPREWVLVVTGTFTRPVTASDKAHQLRIARRCGLRLVHVELG